MNIFVLHSNPKRCAALHVDKHVVKMILESAQMICTTHHLHPNQDMKYDIPYKKSFVNHPCTKWVRTSIRNYEWLLSLTTALNDEYRYRYDKKTNHKSFDVIKKLPLPNLPDNGLTRWARAMPLECKVGNNVIESYRNYYKMKKKRILRYTKRNIPIWAK